MSKEHFYLLAFLVLVWLAILKWSKIAAFVFPKQALGVMKRDFRSSAAFTNHRGVQNNNPGNLKQTTPRQGWIGAVDAPEDSTFEEFEYYVYGVRAMVKLVRNKITRNGKDTIRKLITTWAPASDNNNTANYIAFVAEESEMDEDDRIDPNDKEQMWRIVSAIEQFENGLKVMAYQEFKDAWTLL